MPEQERSRNYDGARRVPPLTRFARREPVAWLTLMAIIAISFAVTSFFVRRYRGKRADLGRQWYAQGEADLRAGRAAAAGEAFTNSLAYQPNSFAAEFALAQALVEQNRIAEAESYYLALWQQAPQSGPLNADLARLAARGGRNTDVIRYYHNAIFGLWPEHGVARSRQARRDLIAYLLAHGALDQADSELLAAIRELPPTAAAHLAAGRDLLAAGDAAHALAQFRAALRFEPANGAALAGAGEAAYRQGNYGLAHRYLARAAVRLPDDRTVGERLATTTEVLNADPFRYHLSRQERRHRVLRDGATAQARLAACAGASPSAGATSTWAPLLARGKSLQRSRAGGRFFRNPNAIPNAMAFVFAVEEETARSCGSPTGVDLALLLIARARESTAP